MVKMMAQRKKPVFDYKLCVSCGICAQACPVSCIELCESGEGRDKNLYPKLIADCLGCGTCQRSCPLGAVAMEGGD